MEEEKLIKDFLLAAGFKECGKSAYKKEGIGYICITRFDVEMVMFQIMELGRKHQAKEIRDSLMIQDELLDKVQFNPQA